MDITLRERGMKEGTQSSFYKPICTPRNKALFGTLHDLYPCNDSDIQTLACHFLSLMCQTQHYCLSKKGSFDSVAGKFECVCKQWVL